MVEFGSSPCAGDPEYLPYFKCGNPKSHGENIPSKIGTLSFASKNQTSSTQRNPPNTESGIRGKFDKLSAGNSISLDEKLSLLSECESGRVATALNPNDGGSPSYGAFQFKYNTLRTFALRYNLRTTITTEDLFNPSLQRAVAKKMIEASPANWRLWYNCAKKLNFIQ